MKKSSSKQSTNTAGKATNGPRAVLKLKPSCKNQTAGRPGHSDALIKKTKTAALSQRIARRTTVTTTATATASATTADESQPPPPIITLLPKVTTTNAMRSIWYLGGNQLVELLTSVDGDLDHAMLANIAEVPSVIGDLALSVESLVSDDATIGGFEYDLLAQIALNTLTAKWSPPLVYQENAPFTPAASQAQSQASDDASFHSVNTEDTQPQTIDTAPIPLASYQPVPNPLARITPPASPLTTMSNK